MFLFVAGSSQELVEQLTLHDPYPVILQSLSHTGVSVVIYVGNEHLHEVSNSVTLAENWVRTHVLSHYPATKVTTIIVGNTVSPQQKPRTPDKFGPAFCEELFPISHEVGFRERNHSLCVSLLRLFECILCFLQRHQSIDPYSPSPTPLG